MFIRMIKTGLITLGLVAGTLVQAAPQEGKDYQRLAAPQPVAQPGKLEVIEFFWYGCPHCYAIEPHAEAWAKTLPKDVNFRRVHVMWPGRGDLEGHAKIFVTLQQMGLAEKHSLAVFNAVQRDRLELRREEVLFNWVKKQGIDVAKFKSIYSGFGMSVAINKLAQATQAYRVEGVPLFVVNGKYMTSPGMVGREDNSVFAVIDALLASERKTAPAAPAKKK
ncbi:thiol:disulfide interchange protein DsbA/DsbL [Chitiniphilus purpureus]|uniref:Thiol:disulfide interchange protein n=1 Tax=Chitiniphilus purpureus TaxID=2981137 RepID=A0ABY6DN03_9NEIS|nr:thiol:disulfide interchange protein DsbA/DsbL [Chitiniphilus sp. CD1]UXY15734.1 thiol:disulfide interchange protein DsbA/DsbL [Chitiniphilus sp. CD1]